MNSTEQAGPCGSPLTEELGPRDAFERYFLWSRKNKGVAKRPTFDRLADDTYADDHTQRHWWTWQQAQAAERERCAKVCDEAADRLRNSGCKHEAAAVEAVAEDLRA